ncbi:hypothetical protein C8F04DRAFT_1202734 [Mycena alexandri]|uniref:Uncharacterized protein n=1 Tax=Mycena alexandri TaxID=1745969 RepID=A0AAD6RW85_9AGAR|nr:hypothetical protein C8F04DRAFT_1202734 [Mycena alexandri]
MTGATGNTPGEVRPLTRTERRLKRTRHRTAQRRYREKNKEALREKARTQMQLHRARIQKSPELKAEAKELRHDTDARYRERFGEDAFNDIYLPQFAIHGNQTHKLRFVKETEKAAAARLATTAPRDGKLHTIKTQIVRNCIENPPSRWNWTDPIHPNHRNHPQPPELPPNGGAAKTSSQEAQSLSGSEPGEPQLPNTWDSMGGASSVSAGDLERNQRRPLKGRFKK